MDFQNKRVTVMGLGLYKEGSGTEAVKFFLRHGAKVTVTDLRSSTELASSVKALTTYWLQFHSRNKKQETRNKNLKFVFGGHKEEDFKNADVIFQNPSVPADSPYLRLAEKRNIPIVNDWSIFLSRHTPKLFIGITGTRGKSTTTALIYEMLRKEHPHLNPLPSRERKLNNLPLPVRERAGVRGKVWLAGNLGVSPLSFIDIYRGEPIVAELSSWLLHHFSTAKKSPNVAVVTNIMNDHLDKYRSMREYIADKENIFRFQKKSDVLLLNRDNSYTRAMARHARGRVVWFSSKRLASSVERIELKLLGEHNVTNVNAAVAAAKVLGIAQQHIMQALKSFSGLPGRLELTRTVNGVRYYNDTTATTPEATIAALKTLGNPHPNPSPLGRGKGEGKPLIILIAGGADKKLDYREMAKYVKKYCKVVVLLPGSATNKLKLEIGNWKLEIAAAQSMKDAVTKAARLTKQGDIVLLSPAAASFGLFQNEFDRGKQFVDAVCKL